MVVKFKWELTYNTYLAIHTSSNIGFVIFHHNYSLRASRTSIMQCSYYSQCIKHNWSCVINLTNCVCGIRHRDRLAPYAMGLSCPRDVCLNKMYTKHNILFHILYCLICQLINNIIMSPIKSMIHDSHRCMVSFTILLLAKY